MEGSKFTLCVKNEGGNFVHVQGIEGIGEEGLIDLTDKSEMTFSGLGNGTYMLSEINAPTGYVILNQDTYFSVSNGAVTLTDESGNPKAYTDVSLLDENTSIAVKNNPGAALPHTGGPGTRLFYLLGGMLLLIAGRKMSGGRFL